MNRQVASHDNLRTLGLQIIFGLTIVGYIAGYGSFAISGVSTSLQWRGGWLEDTGTEMVGAAITILLVELVIYQNRDEASRLDRERMRHRDHFAERLKQAKHPDKRQRILDRMKRQSLLVGAWLYEVDLHNVDLQSCDLHETDFFESNLEAANLASADLTDAILRRANLARANLNGANLEGADLESANLQGADLFESILIDADLENAYFDLTTRLPNGRRWQPGVDLGAFTQQHSDVEVSA